MENILIVGGAGYIGSHTLKYLRQAGYSPIVYDNLSQGHREAVLGAPLMVGEMGDQAQLRAVLREFKIQTVMGFAGLIQVGESVLQPERYYKVNFEDTCTLIETLLSEKVPRFIFSSSCAIYGTPQHLPLTETHPFAPLSPYAESKALVEKQLQIYAQTHPNFNYISLRYFNACGADPEGQLGEAHIPETHLIPLIIQTLTGQKKELIIYGQDYPTPDGTCIRDYIHVWDLSQAHLLAMNYLKGKKQSDVFNLGNGQGYSVLEIVQAIEKLSGQNLPIRWGERRPGDPANLIGSSHKARAILGWRPAWQSLEQILTSAWNWHQNPQYPPIPKPGE